MIGTYDLAIAAVSVLLSLAAVAVCVRSKYFLAYFWLNLYLVSNIAFMVGSLYTIWSYGYTSPQYFYFYFTGDAIMSVLSYLLIGSFFIYLFRHSVFRKYIQLTLVFFFVGVVIVSGSFISGSVDRLYSRWVIEFEQNMYFVGVLLTFLLWMTMSYLGAETRRFVLLVSGMGIFFTAHAANYALRFLVPGLADVLARVPPLAYTFMVLLWLYTFLRVPEGEPAVEAAGARGGLREVLVKVQIARE
ncbi:MAG: hypothetical protein ACE5HL_03405 [Terriglobia bacterium]